VYTGLRPGEKLFEELFHELEPYAQTKHEKILLAHPREANWENLGLDLREAESAVKRYDTRKIQQILLKLVPELAKSSIGTAMEGSDVIALNRPA
ncbi:MAG: polysaccharide biosynthesis protein, partial [Lysobacterales bacterium]